MAQMMKKVAKDSVQVNSGAVYNETKTLLAADTTEYILPYKNVTAIVADITGDGSLWFTMSSPVDIIAGSAVYYEWWWWFWIFGINLGTTGFRVVWGSGTVVATVTVRTSNS